MPYGKAPTVNLPPGLWILGQLLRLLISFVHPTPCRNKPEIYRLVCACVVPVRILALRAKFRI